MKLFLTFIFILILSAIVAVLYIPGQPFKLTEDMAFPKDYSERFIVNAKDPIYGSVFYQDEILKNLMQIKVRNLLPLRCGDSFIRTEQGVYILENEKSKFKHTRRIKNDKFLEFMRNKEPLFPVGKKILTGKICETSQKTILLFYSVGEYDIRVVDTTNIRKAILYSKDNSAYLEVIPDGYFRQPRIFRLAESAFNLRCDKPFQLDMSNSLTILCHEEQDWETVHSVYTINLISGEIKVIGTCRNKFENYGNRLVETVCD